MTTHTFLTILAWPTALILTIAVALGSWDVMTAPAWKQAHFTKNAKWHFALALLAWWHILCNH